MNFKKEDFVFLTSFIVVVAILIGGIHLGLASEKRIEEKKLNEFCIEKGYKNLTDYNKGKDYNKFITVECDNKILSYDLILSNNYECVEWDKWKDCIKREKISLLFVFGENKNG